MAGETHGLPVAELGKTEAGNYFVANYPPFSLWTPERVGEATDRLQTRGDPSNPLGLYVHIPFCRKRCHFCYFKVYTDRNKDDIRAYLDAVIAEVERLGRTPFVEGRTLDFVYFGGGTPSYLSTEQLRYLFDGLRGAVSWEGAREIAFECEPGTLNEKKVHAIAQLGVTRLSLGIENFDDDVLEINNRAHRSRQVHDACAWAPSAGFEQINIDLIAGMVGETPENWRRCIERALEMAPDVVTIYQMEVPFNTTIYRDMREQGREIAPVADWPTKRQWVADAFDAFEAAGYHVASAYTVVKDPARTKFVYRDALWDGADMLGTGVSSFGLLGPVHYQNRHRIEQYVEEVERGASAIYRAMTMTDEERMIRQFVLQMKLGRLSRRPFIERFGVDVFDRFADTLQAYAQSGLLSIEGDVLTLSREGLLQVDRLLHAFFLPEHREVRYA
ncbi:MAG: coproporphyrinogen III oxidase [Phycisphaeraceae bacterium]|nr:coproporphyrinogen III oxidase [Phycisphaeraceae bacterium]